jgi:hypothetical protein
MHLQTEKLWKRIPPFGEFQRQESYVVKDVAKGL